MKRNALIRTLCAVLCAAMLLGVSAAPLSASAADNASIAVIPTRQVNDDPGFFDVIINAVFYNIGFVGFILDPYQFTVINQKPVFQYIFGFNDLYDAFTWGVNVWADMIKCEFNYGGKDWRIQFWKGGYGTFLATGGEIGIYTKPESRSFEHYDAAAREDWLYLTYTMYNRGEELYTRPSPYLISDDGPYWWAPGYKILSISTDFMSSPRANVVMDATVEFKDNKMAQLFIDCMKKKGFKALGKGLTMGLGTPETYVLLADKKSVRFIWQNVNEGYF